ncbi:hypothetical protein QR680_017912 [Steinernema hermaphroditum]|uniref:Uncharacterized protein n=1 Tax=Steinernema hermaphroditum TaxID=289476 RepID=A0AA39LQ88_9BILA|nr:hypothetical protein QR680_017912 [Steinernema hermaphroditum]
MRPDFGSNKRKWLLAAGFAILVVLAAVGITLGIVFGTKHKEDRGSPLNPTRDLRITVAFNVGLQPGTNFTKMHSLVSKTMADICQRGDMTGKTIMLKPYASEPVRGSISKKVYTIGEDDTALMNDIEELYEKHSVPLVKDPSQEAVMNDYKQSIESPKRNRRSVPASDLERTIILFAPSGDKYTGVAMITDSKAAGSVLKEILPQTHQQIVVNTNLDKSQAQTYYGADDDNRNVLAGKSVTAKQIVDGLSKEKS